MKKPNSEICDFFLYWNIQKLDASHPELYFVASPWEYTEMITFLNIEIVSERFLVIWTSNMIQTSTAIDAVVRAICTGMMRDRKALILKLHKFIDFDLKNETNI